MVYIACVITLYKYFLAAAAVPVYVTNLLRIFLIDYYMYVHKLIQLAFNVLYFPFRNLHIHALSLYQMLPVALSRCIVFFMYVCMYGTQQALYYSLTQHIFC